MLEGGRRAAAAFPAQPVRRSRRELSCHRRFLRAPQNLPAAARWESSPAGLGARLPCGTALLRCQVGGGHREQGLRLPSGSSVINPASCFPAVLAEVKYVCFALVSDVFDGFVSQASMGPHIPTSHPYTTWAPQQQ